MSDDQPQPTESVEASPPTTEPSDDGGSGLRIEPDAPGATDTGEAQQDSADAPQPAAVERGPDWQPYNDPDAYRRTAQHYGQAWRWTTTPPPAPTPTTPRPQAPQPSPESLPVWHARHPDRAAFKAQFDEFRRLALMHQRAKTDEARAEIAAELERFTPEQRRQFEEYQKHRQRIGEQLAEELAGYNSLGEYVAQQVQHHLQIESAKARAVSEVNRWFDDPQNHEIISRMAPAMREALEAGVPFQYVAAMARMRHQLDQLSQAVGSFMARQAAEQRAAHQRAATITNDVAPQAARVDPVKLARERGIDVSSSAYVRLLSELSAKGLL